VFSDSSLSQFLIEVDIYIGMELSVVPVFQSEIAPTRIRGFMVGTYQLTIVVCLKSQEASLLSPC
jgi:hypothetical protein